MAYFGITSIVSVTQTKIQNKLMMISVLLMMSDCKTMSVKLCVSVQVIQGGVVGRLTARYSDNSLLLLSIAVASFVGLAQVHTKTLI